MGQSKGLSTILVRGNLSNDLCCYITCSEEAVRSFDHGLRDNRAVLQHIFEVDQITVMLSLSEIIGVMEMNNAFLMSTNDVFRKKHTLGQILRYFAGHVVTLSGVDHRILIGILLLYFLICLIDQGEDSIIGSIRLTGDFSLISVADILLCYFIAAHLHDASLNHILDIFDIDGMRCGGNFLRNVVSDSRNLVGIHLMNLIHLMICL